MKSSKALATLALLPLALTACGSNDTQESKPMESVSPIQSESPSDKSATPETNDRGNIEKKIGEEGAVTNKDGKDIYTFKVTDISVDPKCNSDYIREPQNGRFVKVDLQVTTANAKVMKEDYMNNTVFMGAPSWKYIAKNGTTFNGMLGSDASYACLDSSQNLPSTIGPAEKVSGSLILDVPSTDGVLVYSDGSTGDIGGWEYKIPQG